MRSFCGLKNKNIYFLVVPKSETHFRKLIYCKFVRNFSFLLFYKIEKRTSSNGWSRKSWYFWYFPLDGQKWPIFFVIFCVNLYINHSSIYEDFSVLVFNSKCYAEQTTDESRKQVKIPFLIFKINDFAIFVMSSEKRSTNLHFL